MQHMSRRFTLSLVALLIVLGAYTAGAQQPVTLTLSIWGDVQQQTVWQRVVDAFHEAQNGIRVEIEWSRAITKVACLRKFSPAWRLT